MNCDQERVGEGRRKHETTNIFNDSGYKSFCSEPSEEDVISLVNEEDFKPMSTSERFDGTATQVKQYLIIKQKSSPSPKSKVKVQCHPPHPP